MCNIRFFALGRCYSANLDICSFNAGPTNKNTPQLTYGILLDNPQV